MRKDIKAIKIKCGICGKMIDPQKYRQHDKKHDFKKINNK